MERCDPKLHQWNRSVCVRCRCTRTRAAKDDVLRIVRELRELAPTLRGEGVYASDASFNRVLRCASELEKIGAE